MPQTGFTSTPTLRSAQSRGYENKLSGAKMEFVVRVLLFFTFLCFHDFVFCEDYAEMGGLITFSPSIRGKPVEILWKHNGDKIVEYDNSEMEEYGSFKDRVELDFETGQLTIKKLTSQDGGQYQSDITINGKVQSSRHTLTVLDVLPDPRVTCEVNETSNLQELLCSVDYKTPLLYKWSGPNVIDHPGAKLIIDEQQKNSDSIYTCTVKNEVSSKTTDFNLQDCVTGVAAARLQVILPVLFVILLFIFLIILAVFIYRRRKSRSEQKKRDPENALSEATLPSQTRLKYPNDSDKKRDEGSGSDNTGENEEKTALLNHNGNEEELYRSENSRHAVIEEENANSKPDETQKLQEDRDEEEEGQSDELEKGNEIGKTSLEHLNKTPEEFKIDDGDDDENNVKIPGEKKEEVNGEEKDQQNTALSEATLSSQTRLMHQKDLVADKKQDEDNGSDNTGENGGKAKALKDSGNEEEQCSNENSRHAVVEEENSNRKPDETQKLQDEEEEGQTEKLDKGNEMGETSVKELIEKLESLNINNSDYKDKISEEKKQEGNKEQKDQQSTELPGVLQDLATQETSTAQPSNGENHKEENQKPEKRNESGETSAQQQNEGVKTEVTVRNEDQQTAGANTQEEDHEEMRESDTDSEKPPIENNSDAFSSLKDRRADTDIHDENKTVKSDDNKEDIETKAEQNNDDDDAEGLQNEGTAKAISEDDDNKAQRDKSCEPKQEDMKENNDAADAGINKHLNDNDPDPNPDQDRRKDDLSVPEDEQHETPSDNLQKQEHLSKQNSTEGESQLQRENGSEESDTDSDL